MNTYSLKEIYLLVFLAFASNINLFAQHVSLQENYDVKHYHISVSANNDSTYITATTQIIIEIIESSDSVIFDLGEQLSVTKVTVNGTEANYNHQNDKLIVVSDNFQKESVSEISICYEGDGNSPKVEGALFHKTYAPYGGFTYSLTEPYSTKYWFPCKEILSDKADSVFVYITIPKGLKAGSVGLLKEIVSVDDNNNEYRWESRYPTAFYLISIAIGNYQDYTIYSEGDQPYPIVNYIYDSETFLEQQKDNIDTTVHLLSLFSELYGNYPFEKEKYGHCIAPVGGGMEHQTMTTLGNFGFDLVSHELAHQWFGDYVTCSAWNHIWVNEGFASYSEYLAHEFSGDMTGAQSWLAYAQQQALNSSGLSIFVPDDELEDASRVFNYSTTYKKGAAIIHMIRNEIGNDKLFFEALRQFLSRFGYGVASADDLQLVLEDISGKSFENFFDQWYYGKGYPIFNIEWYQLNDTLVIINTQTGSEPDATPFFNMSLQYKLSFPTGDTIIDVGIDAPITTTKLFFNKAVYKLSIDPDDIILKEVNSIHSLDSLSDSKLSEIIIFPNPAGDSIQVFSITQNEPVNLFFYNLTGAKIKSVENIIPSGDEISIRDLKKGVYMVAIEIGGRQSVLKLIKS